LKKGKKTYRRRIAAIKNTVSKHIRKHGSSYVDPNGYLFEYQDTLYRAIHREAKQFYLSLFTDGTIDALSAEYSLVPSAIADVRIDDSDVGLIVEHERIEPATYCVEWCPEMLFDAAAATVDLLRAVLQKNATLQDAYPWNIMFRGVKPVFVDLTSIVKIDTPLLWQAYDQFQAFFLRPLALSAQGKGAIARTLLYNNISGISLQDFFKHSNFSYKLAHPMTGIACMLDDAIQRNARLRRQLRRATVSTNMRVNNEVRSRFYQRIMRKLNGLRISGRGDVWTRYYEEIGSGVNKDFKRQVVAEILDAIRPPTVVDIGCNTGVFSILAAERGARVISIDSSEACISRLYAHAKASCLSITPVISDIVCPTPPFGYMGIQYPSLIHRARSKLVLCLGLMHHLHIAGRQPFDRIARLLDALSSRYLIFEFVAMDDANNELLGARRTIDYTLESVITEIRRYFPEINIRDSDRCTRKILLCSKPGI
jgi:SAM-dependent methyltransferase